MSCPVTIVPPLHEVNLTGIPLSPPTQPVASPPAQDPNGPGIEGPTSTLASALVLTIASVPVDVDALTLVLSAGLIGRSMRLDPCVLSCK
mmetsp:Transcript_21428/g.35465  ORF Transcript_21428/g.35465 Transcript_21428/m.35465 type:complete len:90 (-) Transcript_21428:1823-2092(-)